MRTTVLLHRIQLSVVLTMSCSVLASPAATHADVLTYVLTGDATPSGNGTFSGGYGPAVLNDLGNIGFSANLTGTSGGTANDFGMFLGTPAGLSEIMREGDSSPDGNGTLSGFFSAGPTFNNANQFAGLWRLNGTSGGLDDDTAILRSSTSMVEIVAREDRATPGGFLQFTAVPPINNVGEIAFQGAHDGSPATNDFIYVGTPGSLTAVVQEGDAVPGSGGRIFGAPGFPYLNDSGQVGYTAPTPTVAPPPVLPASGVFIGTTEVAAQGDTVPGGNGEYSTFTVRELNDAAEVLFTASLVNTSGGFLDNGGVFLASAGGVVQIAQEGDAAPDGNGSFNAFFDAVVNDSGEAAVHASLGGTSGFPFDDTGIYVSDGVTIGKRFREGDPLPNGVGTYGGFTDYAMNNAGHVVVRAGLATPGGGLDNEAIYITDGIDVVRVARDMDALEGSSISNLGLFGGPMDNNGLNDDSQVAFSAVLANGQSGLFLFTPDLHYRNPVAGLFGDGSNWTLGIAPAPKYNAFFDPSAPLTIDGPAADTTVKSLTIGGGGADAALRLQSGVTLTATEGVRVETDGTLSGEGDIVGDATILGTLATGTSAGLISVDGDMTFDFFSSPTYQVELGGLNRGTEYDAVDVTGHAQLRGNLEVTLINAFVPSAGDDFQIISSATRGGSFSFPESGTGLLNNQTFLLAIYEGTGLSLRALIPGDGNLDDIVDASDYTIWANNFGPEGVHFTLGDYNGDLMVDAADYTLWANNFGMTAPGPEFNSQAAVPEPSALLLMCVGTFGVVLLGSRRRTRHRSRKRHESTVPGTRR